MANEKVIHLNDPATFEEQTKEGYAWSILGRLVRTLSGLAPTIDSLADKYDGQLKVCKVDVDSNRDSAAKFQSEASLSSPCSRTESWLTVLPTILPESRP